MPELKKRFGNEAIFVGVNLDEVDKNSELGRRADQSIGTSGISIRSVRDVYTEMGSVTPTGDGKAGEFKSTCTLYGIGSRLIATLQQQAGFTNSDVAASKGSFKLGPVEPRELYARRGDRVQKQGEIKSEDVAAANKTVRDELAAAKGSKDFGEAEKHHLAALKASDSISMGQLNTLLENLRKTAEEERRKEESKQDKVKLAKLEKEQQEATDFLDAKSKVRLEMGLACGNAGQTESGKKWILEAGRRNPQLFDMCAGSAGLAQAMSANKFSEADISDVFEKARKPEYAALTDDKIEKIEGAKPADASDKAERTWTRIKSKRDWDETLARAEKEKKPIIVIGGGREWCKYCKSMEDAGAYKGVLDKYGDKAIVVHVDPGSKDAAESEIGQQVYSQLGMSGSPVTAVISVSRTSRGLVADKPDRLFDKENWSKVDPKRQIKEKHYHDFLKSQFDAAKERMKGSDEPRRRLPPKYLAFLDFSEAPDIYGDLREFA